MLLPETATTGLKNFNPTNIRWNIKGNNMTPNKFIKLAKFYRIATEPVNFNQFYQVLVDIYEYSKELLDLERKLIGKEVAGKFSDEDLKYVRGIIQNVDPIDKMVYFAETGEYGEEREREGLVPLRFVIQSNNSMYTNDIDRLKEARIKPIYFKDKSGMQRKGIIYTIFKQTDLDRMKEYITLALVYYTADKAEPETISINIYESNVEDFLKLNPMVYLLN
jgi:hypothetical protein